METKNLLSGYIQFGNLLILGGSMDCGGLETCMSPGGVKLGFWPWSLVFGELTSDSRVPIVVWQP